MNESTIQTEIKDWINDLPNGKSIVIPGNMFIETGTPDILACVDSRFVAIEVKDPNSTHGLSDIQEYRLKQWMKSGAMGIVAERLKDVQNDLAQNDLYVP